MTKGKYENLGHRAADNSMALVHIHRLSCKGALAPTAMCKRIAITQPRVLDITAGAAQACKAPHFLPVSKLSERLMGLLRSCPFGSGRPDALPAGCAPAAPFG
jgi:hypothetical protein